MVERVVQAVILGMHAPPCYTRWHRRVVEDGGEVESARLPMVDGILGIEHVDAANHLVDGAESEFRHVLPDLLGEEEKEIDNMLGLTLELLAQHRILRGNADRASVEMTLAHHDATHRNQRGGGKTKFLGAQERGDDHIAAGLQLAIGLYADTAAQIVEQENLLRLGEADFPGNAGVLDGTERRGASTAGITADQHDVGMRLRYTGSDGAHADFRD